MAEYIDREHALETQCEKCPVYNCVIKCNSYNAIKNLPPADVIERAEYDKLYEEHLKAIHRHTECLKELHEYRSKIDKAIEEIEIYKKRVSNT